MQATAQNSSFYYKYQNRIQHHSQNFISTFNRKDFARIAVLTLKVSFRLAVLAIVLFVGYVFGLGLYNARSIRDPCGVAMTSKQKIHELLTVERSWTDVKQSTLELVPRTAVNSVASSSSVEFDDEPEQQGRQIGSNNFVHKAEVPKIIHQQWKDERIPNKFMKWRTKWLTLYPEPEYKYMLWTDTNGRELIQKHYPWFLETYDAYEHNINKADATRYFVLHHYGGIYADLDYEPMINFYEYLPKNQVGVVESPYYWNEQTQNCLMSSPQGDPFWLDLFFILFKNAKKEEVLEATGPILLDQAREYSMHPSYVLPCENFQRVPLGEYDQTLWTTVYDREIMFRLKPISKNCGVYKNDQCHFGKHHNTVSYRTLTGQIL